MMSNWNGSWDWSSWTAMGLMMLLFTAVLVALIIAGVVWATRSTSSHRSFEPPRDVLDRRLAAGEISQEQYVQARALIEDAAAHPV